MSRGRCLFSKLSHFHILLAERYRVRLLLTLTKGQFTQACSLLAASGESENRPETLPCIG